MLEFLLELSQFLQLCFIEFGSVPDMLFLCLLLGFQHFLEVQQLLVLTVKQYTNLAFVTIIDHALILHKIHHFDYGIIILAFSLHLVDNARHNVRVIFHEIFCHPLACWLEQTWLTLARGPITVEWRELIILRYNIRRLNAISNKLRCWNN